jgi:aspartate/methionine/tyrosine aminotransferase
MQHPMASHMWSPNGTDEPVTRQVERLLDEFHPDDRLHIGGSLHVDLPDHVKEAVTASMRAKGYTRSYGETPLREAIATALGGEGVATGTDQILVTNGAMHALDLVFRAVLRPGDEVLMPAPGFFINGLVSMAGADLVQFPSPFEDGFRPSWSSARDYITPRTRILYLNTPVNPTGYVFDDEDIAAAIELARDAELILVSDESLSHFVYGGHRHVSPVIAGQAAVPSVLIRSFSKDFAMPGMRVGYASIPESLFGRVAACLEWSVLCVSRASQAAALAAVTGPRGWVDRMVAEAALRARRIVRAFDAIPLLECVPPAGGLNIFPRYDGDAEALTHDLVVRYGVPLAPGSAFGATGHFRMQFGGRGQDLDRAVNCIRDAVS